MRIACLDDDPLIAEITTILLEELGHEVMSCVDGAHAIELVRLSEPPVEILVVDIHLAGDDGRAIALAARRLNPGLRIIFFTGDTTISDFTEDAIVLHKPCTLGMLESAIGRAVAAIKTPSSAARRAEVGVTAWTMRWGASEGPPAG